MSADNFFRDNNIGWELAGDGDECRINCIRCRDTKHHLYVNRVSGKAYCHKCGTRYHAFSDLVRGIKRVTRSEAIRIASRYGMAGAARPVASWDLELEVEEEREETLPESRLAIPTDPFGREAYAYLSGQRGISLEEIYLRNLRFCLGGDYKQMIIVPFTENGKVVYYMGRSFMLGSKAKRLPAKGKEVSRGKSEVVYNIDGVTGKSTIIITEGPFDAIRVGDNAVAVCGKYLSSMHKNKILAKRPEKIVVMLDSDAHHDTLVMADELSRYHRNVHVVLLSEGDPGETSRHDLNKLIADSTKYSWSMLYQNVA